MRAKEGDRVIETLSDYQPTCLGCNREVNSTEIFWDVRAPGQGYIGQTVCQGCVERFRGRFATRPVRL